MVRKIIGKGATYKERLICRIPFQYCGMEIILGYMMTHWRQMHGTNPAMNWNQILVSQI